MYLPPAPVIRAIPAPQAGVVVAYDTRAIGLAVIGLGGGRRAAGDRVDPRVGFAAIAPIGASVGKGDPLAMVHAASEGAAEQACAAFLAACDVAEAAEHPDLVTEIL